MKKTTKTARDNKKLRLVKEIVKAHLTQVTGGGAYAVKKAEGPDHPSCGCGPC